MHLNPSISLTGAVLRGSKIEKHTHIYIYVYINIYREKFGNSFFENR